MLMQPISLLALLFPISLSILWSRRKAASVTAGGTIGGILLLSVGYAIALGQGYAIPYFLLQIPIFLIAAFFFSLAPAALFGLVAFAGSNYLKGIGIVRDTQNLFNRMNNGLAMGLVASLLIGTASIFILTGGRTIFYGVMILSYVALYLVFYTLLKRKLKNQDPVNIIQERGDWKLFIGLSIVLWLT